MLTLRTNNLETVVEVKVDGKITERDMEEFKDYFKLKKEADGTINLLLVINSLEGYSIKGLIEDLKFDAKHWGDVEKVAVVSDKKWIEIGTKISGYLPKVDTKHFNRIDREKALDWLSER